ADEPGVIPTLARFRQDAVGRHAGEEQPALLLHRLAVVDVHLITVTVALIHIGLAVDLADLGARAQGRSVSGQVHAAAHVPALLALDALIALNPLGHQADDGFVRGAELSRGRLGEARQVPRRLDHRHLHAEADAEIGNLALASIARRLDLALRAALPEAARHQNGVGA